MNRDVFDAVGKLTFALVNGPVSQSIRNKAVRDIEEGMSAVGTHLKAGFEGGYSGNPGYGWPRLTKEWQRRKVSRNRSKFWKNKGDLANGYAGYAQQYSSALGKSAATVKTRLRQNRFGRKSMSYEMSLEMLPFEDTFFTKFIRDSFVSGEPWAGHVSYDLESGDNMPTLQKIGVLEGVGQSHRPFIAKLMAARGKKFGSGIQGMINRAVGNSGLLKT